MFFLFLYHLLGRWGNETTLPPLPVQGPKAGPSERVLLLSSPKHPKTQPVLSSAQWASVQPSSVVFLLVGSLCQPHPRNLSVPQGQGLCPQRSSNYLAPSSFLGTHDARLIIQRAFLNEVLFLMFQVNTFHITKMQPHCDLLNQILKDILP